MPDGTLVFEKHLLVTVRAPVFRVSAASALFGRFLAIPKKNLVALSFLALGNLRPHLLGHEVVGQHVLVPGLLATFDLLLVLG